jgi:FlaG/FlaF family flagellin (archaellin)
MKRNTVVMATADNSKGIQANNQGSKAYLSKSDVNVHGQTNQNKGYYQINTDGADMVIERSAISKNINNSQPLEQPLISNEPLVQSFNQVPLPSVGAVNFAAKQGIVSKSMYPGRAGL